MSGDEKQQYHHGNLRAALLETAVLHLREEGIEKLSLRAMARELGVSQTAPYRHFQDRNALLAALAADGFAELKAATAKAAGKYPKDAAAALQACGIAYVKFARSNPERYLLMFGPGIVERQRYEDLVSNSDASFQVLLDVIEQAQREGLFSRKPALMVANTAWALVHGLSTLVIGHLQWVMSEKELEQQISLATGMLVNK
ncbi:MAG TPA: TetR/AcrR family transcriptional regulator [Gallionella sp.]|nr:TetR/AcrR family transcriptional regulator [Gallionella sp.]